MRLRCILGASFLLILAGCIGCGTGSAPAVVGPATPPQVAATVTSASPAATPAPTATLPPTLTPTATLTPTPVLPVLRVRASEAVQAALVAAGADVPAQLTQNGQPHRVELVASGDTPLALELLPVSEAAEGVAIRHVAAVLPFHSVQDEISSDALATAWRGEAGLTLVVDPQAAAALTVIWGQHAASVTIGAVSAAGLREDAVVGLVGFDHLEPTLKVLRVDGVDVLSNQFDPTSDPLGVALVLQGPDELVAQLEPLVRAWGNRDASQLTQLVMTGVTALCRLTAGAHGDAMASQYPAAVVGPVLRQRTSPTSATRCPLSRAARSTRPPIAWSFAATMTIGGRWRPSAPTSSG